MLLDRHGAPAHAPADDAQALLEEARARARRRWWRRLAVGLALATIAATVAVVFGGTAGPRLVRVADGGPSVDARAFSGHGELAFVSHDALWVLADGRVRRVFAPRGTVPGQPAFSPDGRGLAYVTSVSEGGSLTPTRLWVARADGADARRLATGIDYGFAWSPTADRLEVLIGQPDPSRLEVISASGATRTILAVDVGRPIPKVIIWDALWSPDGTRLAVSSTIDGVSLIRSYPLSGGRPTTWYRIAASQRLRGICGGCGGREVTPQLAGWWPRWGIAFWVFSSGATRELDGSWVGVVARPGAPLKLLAQTLPYGEMLAPGRGGRLAVVANSTNRVIGAGKTVEDCAARTLTCRALPGASIWSGPNPQRCPFGSCSKLPQPGDPGSAVTLEPAWSPDGSLLAYVKGPLVFSSSPTRAWYGKHELLVWDAAADTTTRLAAIGADAPVWSADGRDLLYVAGNGLWMVPVSGGRPVEIEDPLLPSDWQAGFVYDFYGEVFWDQQFSWFSGPRS